MPSCLIVQFVQPFDEAGEGSASFRRVDIDWCDIASTSQVVDGHSQRVGDGDQLGSSERRSSTFGTTEIL